MGIYPEKGTSLVLLTTHSCIYSSVGSPFLELTLNVLHVNLGKEGWEMGVVGGVEEQ